MEAPLASPIRHPSLSRIVASVRKLAFHNTLLARFTLISLGATVVVAVGLGWLLGRQIAEGALDQVAREAAQTVAAFVTPFVRGDDFAAPSPDRVAAWRRRVGQVAGKTDIVRIKVWNADGQVVYSDNPGLIGKTFPLAGHPRLREALEGRLVRQLSALEEPEHAAERAYGRLMEIYVPAELPGVGVVGAYEVYQRFVSVQARIGSLTRLVRGTVAVAFGLLYVVLFALVNGASRRLVRQEHAMRASNARFQRLFESVPDAVVVVDREGRILQVNAQAETMFGFTRGELLGRPVEALTPERFRARHAEHRRGYMTAPRTRPMGTGLELRGRRKDGSEFPTDIMLSPLEVAGDVAVISVVRDISKRKRAEEQLRKLSRAVEQSPGIVVITDTNENIEYINPRFTEVTGFAPEEVLGTKATDLAEQLPPEEYRRLLETITAGGTWQGEFHGHKKAGDRYWELATVSSIRDDAGKITHFIKVAEDITERKGAEEQILDQLETITALYATAQKLPQSLDLRQLADYVVSTCVRTFGARLAWLGRAEADGAVRLLAHSPPESDYPHKITVRWDDSPQGQGPTGRALRTGFPVVIADIATDPGFSQHRETALAAGFRCTGVFPLTSRDQPFGVLILHSDQSGFFTPSRVDFYQAFAHQAAAALENARLFEEAGRRLEQVQALRDIDKAITASVDLRVTLNVLLDQTASILNVHAASVLLLNPHTQILEYAAGRGFRSSGIERSRLRLGEGHAGRAALERRIVGVPDLAATGTQFARSVLLADEGFVSYYAAPLVSKGQVKGVLETFYRTPREASQDWLDFLEALASQAAIAIDNAALFNDLQRSGVELTLAYDTTLEGWSRALDLRDKETEGHTQRVAELTVRLARAIGMNEEELVHVRRGALLHDIGKMGIPDSILLMPGPLNEEEWEVMRRHPVYAYELLSPIAYLRPALDIPYCHHEKWDGTGYPRGLRGEQIPLAARIFAVVDVWDALRSDRPYRPAWTDERAREYIGEQAGKHFGPKVVEAFLALQPGDDP